MPNSASSNHETTDVGAKDHVSALREKLAATMTVEEAQAEADELRPRHLEAMRESSELLALQLGLDDTE
jgi:hypothetical protein